MTERIMGEVFKHMTREEEDAYFERMNRAMDRKVAAMKRESIGLRENETSGPYQGDGKDLVGI